MRANLHADLASFVHHNAIFVLGICVAIPLWFVALIVLGLGGSS